MQNNRVGPAEVDRISRSRSISVKSAQISSQNSVASFIRKSDTWSGRAVELFKLLLIVLPPLVVMGILAAANVSGANTSRQAALQLQSHLENAESIRALVTALQRERGVTCLLINNEQ